MEEGALKELGGLTEGRGALVGDAVDRRRDDGYYSSLVVLTTPTPCWNAGYASLRELERAVCICANVGAAARTGATEAPPARGLMVSGAVPPETGTGVEETTGCEDTEGDDPDLRRDALRRRMEDAPEAELERPFMVCCMVCAAAESAAVSSCDCDNCSI